MDWNTLPARPAFGIPLQAPYLGSAMQD